MIASLLPAHRLPPSLQPPPRPQRVCSHASSPLAQQSARVLRPIRPSPPATGVVPPTPRAWLTAHNDVFTLVLSAGFFGFYAHAGVLAGLEEAGLRPGRIIGISSGAIAGGFAAAGCSADHIREVLLSLRADDFMDPGRFGLLRGRKLADKIALELPARPGSSTKLQNIEDCPTPFTAVAYDLCNRQTKLLSAGPIEPAMRASCAFPLLFQPVRAGGTLCTDGAVADPLGQRALGADPAPVLLHALPSQSPIKWLTRRLAPRLEDSAQRRVLRIQDLPAVPVQHLERGAVAMQHAHAATRAWLDQ